MTRPQVIRHIEQDAARKRIIAAMLAPPCGSFSAINRFSGRSRQDPWAAKFCHATEYMRLSVATGNRCMRAALQLIRIFEKHKVPWILEHPRTARSWWLPQLQRIASLAHVSTVYLEQCQFGTKWKKSTTLLCSGISDQNLVRLGKRCHGRRNLCSRTWKPHIVLRGAAPCGRNWTSIASPYPSSLNRSLAFCLIDDFRSRTR